MVTEEDGLWPERRGGLFGRGGFEDEFFHFEQAEINAVENEPDTGTEEREDHERGGSDGAGDSRNRAVDHELVHWLDANDDACQKKRDADRAEKSQWFVGLEHQEEFEKDSESIRESVQLGEAAFGPLAVRRTDFPDHQTAVKRLQGEFGLDIETAGGDGDAGRGFAREGAISREDVADIRTKNAIDDGTDEAVSQKMKVAERAFLVFGEPRC